MERESSLGTQEQLGMGKEPPAAGDEADLQLWVQKGFRESTGSLGTPGM